MPWPILDIIFLLCFIEPFTSIFLSVIFLDLYQAVRMEKEEKVEMLALWERRGWSKGWRFYLTC